MPELVQSFIEGAHSLRSSQHFIPTVILSFIVTQAHTGREIHTNTLPLSPICLEFRTMLKHSEAPGILWRGVSSQQHALEDHPDDRMKHIDNIKLTKYEGMKERQLTKVKDKRNETHR